MTTEQFSAFGEIRDDFKAYVQSLTGRAPWLAEIQEKLRLSRGYEDYAIETPIVYNTALDDIGIGDEPMFIIVADNPGKNEQKASNRRYLVGQSGKLAQGWFGRELGLDFYKAAIIINKTPIHTPKTAELALLQKLAGPRAKELDTILGESQKTMASFAYRLHVNLGSTLWISGYGELGRGKLFRIWAEEIGRLYAGAPSLLRDSVWVFRHFSMNQFAIEYSRFEIPEEADGEADSPLHWNFVMARLEAIGVANRQRILGW